MKTATSPERVSPSNPPCSTSQVPAGVLTTALGSVEPAAFEAVAIDGASKWQTFRYVTLPLIRPVVIAAAAFRAIDALKTFDLILVITGGGPGFASETVDVYAYRTTFQYQRLGYAAAMLIVFFVIVIIATGSLLRLRRPV